MEDETGYTFSAGGSALDPDDGNNFIIDGSSSWVDSNAHVGKDIVFKSGDKEITVGQLLKMYSKVKVLLKKTGACKRCPDRYKAITNGYECCIDYGEDK